MNDNLNTWGVEDQNTYEVKGNVILDNHEIPFDIVFHAKDINSLVVRLSKDMYLKYDSIEKIVSADS